MAERRMFAKTIISSDAFLDMPLSTQALYFHLAMRADDDGFLNCARKIQREVGANQNDYDLLVDKRFILQFDDGICVIKHWRIHNYIRNDRYKETIYKEEKALLDIKENKGYTFSKALIELPMNNDLSANNKLGIPNEHQMDTQVRLGKDSIGKDSIDKSSIDKAKKDKQQKHKYGAYQHVLLTDNEMQKLLDDLGHEMYSKCITFLDEYIEMKGYKAKNHNLAIRKWVVDAVNEREQRNQRANIPKKQEDPFSMLQRMKQEGAFDE